LSKVESVWKAQGRERIDHRGWYPSPFPPHPSLPALPPPGHKAHVAIRLSTREHHSNDYRFSITETFGSKDR
jgi:hypothetical protein